MDLVDKISSGDKLSGRLGTSNVSRSDIQHTVLYGVSEPTAAALWSRTSVSVG